MKILFLICSRGVAKWLVTELFLLLIRKVTFPCGDKFAEYFGVLVRVAGQ